MGQPVRKLHQKAFDKFVPEGGAQLLHGPDMKDNHHAPVGALRKGEEAQAGEQARRGVMRGQIAKAPLGVAAGEKVVVAIVSQGQSKEEHHANVQGCRRDDQIQMGIGKQRQTFADNGTAEQQQADSGQVQPAPDQEQADCQHSGDNQRRQAAPIGQDASGGQRFDGHGLQHGARNDAVARHGEEVPQFDGAGAHHDLAAGKGGRVHPAIEHVGEAEARNAGHVYREVHVQDIGELNRWTGQLDSECWDRADLVTGESGQAAGTPADRIKEDIDQNRSRGGDKFGEWTREGHGAVDIGLCKGGKPGIATGTLERGREQGIVERVAGAGKVDVEGDFIGAGFHQGIKKAGMERARPRPHADLFKALAVDFYENRVAACRNGIGGQPPIGEPAVEGRQHAAHAQADQYQNCRGGCAPPDQLPHGLSPRSSVKHARRALTSG